MITMFLKVNSTDTADWMEITPFGRTAQSQKGKLEFLGWNGPVKDRRSGPGSNLRFAAAAASWTQPWALLVKPLITSMAPLHHVFSNQWSTGWVGGQRGARDYWDSRYPAQASGSRSPVSVRIALSLIRGYCGRPRPTCNFWPSLAFWKIPHHDFITRQFLWDASSSTRRPTWRFVKDLCLFR
ncbi:hypothetical protein J6590_023740 [Homalodisca vitripennis]|nr:hypothetical protein J6590_023740 [Homalodisca vitripennis]